MSNKLSEEKFLEIGTMLVSDYIENFLFAVRLKDYKIAGLSLEGIDNMKPGAYFTEKHSNWFTRALLLLKRLRMRKIRFPKPSRPEGLYKRDIRGGKLYWMWRMICLGRDNWECQVCYIKKGLHVHHIKSYKDYADKRLVVDNGITLCRVHHRLRHK